ncbi:DUF397 domain-containing protein [Actinacidiphila yeochonensis]|uniref:DUF397 domain-containing protein n=1 Tax=Actinacidiphila yeochonensis TaxID=89050 RepID=UPI000566D06F|nr:DUF397 domain-containing protein [Actinacidiphila yeochonensis]
MSNTPDLVGTALVWIKSTYSGPEGGNCVEWAPSYATAHDVVPVRDSKDPQGPALAFSRDAWSSFLTAVREAEFPSA